MTHRNNECRIYVGNLPPDIRTKDIEDLFYKFGKITFIDLKNRRGPPFAFVEFEDPRDAEDAVHSRDGYDYDGYRLRVEFPRGRERGPGGAFISGPRGSSSSSRVRGPPARRSQYRVVVSGLPPTGSWQDLKDHMREAGDVCYADVYKDGTGVVEFLRYEDMKVKLHTFVYVRTMEEAEGVPDREVEAILHDEAEGHPLIRRRVDRDLDPDRGRVRGLFQNRTPHADRIIYNR
ncbi:hypothetical protein B4U79_08406 [Dinothrombium tinctorium]|uniref:RRM domain-containing protein n=1 Tax=Dinothrombium tinctorium TaxID=1965070 RepID=A0A3S3PKU1_9ACAR|nr:hypothetical protein B4U79_08406 [Dinothrombium tinctorium]